MRLPFIADLYRWIIDLKEKMSAGDRATAIKLSSSLKGLWNTLTRSLGQLKGMKNLQLVARREKEEEALRNSSPPIPASAKIRLPVRRTGKSLCRNAAAVRPGT